LIERIGLYPILHNLGKKPLQFHGLSNAKSNSFRDILRRKLNTLGISILVAHHIGFEYRNDAKGLAALGFGEPTNPIDLTHLTFGYSIRASVACRSNLDVIQKVRLDCSLGRRYQILLKIDIRSGGCHCMPNFLLNFFKILRSKGLKLGHVCSLGRFLNILFFFLLLNEINLKTIVVFSYFILIYDYYFFFI